MAPKRYNKRASKKRKRADSSSESDDTNEWYFKRCMKSFIHPYGEATRYSDVNDATFEKRLWPRYVMYGLLLVLSTSPYFRYNY